MKKRILAYIEYIDKILSNDIPAASAFDVDGVHNIRPQKDVIPTRKEYEKIIEHHLNQIQFFQHERLIHLLVTMLFAILTVIVFAICLVTFSYGLLALFALLIVLLIPYIKHYYLLENSVQKMYAQYDELVKKLI